MLFSSLIYRLLPPPRLTRGRIWGAIAIAIAADGLQIMLGPLGWTFVDEIIDVGVMIAASWLIGFHMLFLPTFAVEFIPVIDMVPTWTGCVLTVIALRKRAQNKSATVVPPPLSPPVIREISDGEQKQISQ